MAAIAPITSATGRETTGSTIRNIAVALHTPTGRQRTHMEVQRAGIPRPPGRQMPVSDSNRELVTTHQVPQATREQTAVEGAEAIALETEVCRQARVAVPEGALLAVLRAAVAPHARAVRVVHPAWGPHGAVVRVVAAGGGNR